MIFSANLDAKINKLLPRFQSVKLGDIGFSSPLVLAPMASICSAPFRLLMEELGAGGTVSELISCHGINYHNKKTQDMLRIHPLEKNVGIQLFGEDATAMAKACEVALRFGPKFIDINMGCPVKKVVCKGGGSALLKDPKALGPFLREIKNALNIPLTIKIRTGWDDTSINCAEVIQVAYDHGVEFVSIHGRTRAQKYTGHANWELIESTAQYAPLPIIGNGDLHQPEQVKERLKKTHCQSLMLGRGPLRNPFIFLESVMNNDDDIKFNADDYLAVINRLWYHISNFYDQEAIQLIQMRKHLIWFTTGFFQAAHFRSKQFMAQTPQEIMDIARDYFSSLGQSNKVIDYQEQFMSSGHG